MIITFNGIAPPIKYYAVGVRNNNLVDKLEFVVDKLTDTGLDLSTCTPYIKLQSERDNYIDKDGRVEKAVNGDKLHLTYRLSRKTTTHAAFDVQLQFESPTETDIVVWQTEAITLTMSSTIDADVEIVKQNPTVIQDLTRRVEKIENIKIINGGNP